MGATAFSVHICSGNFPICRTLQANLKFYLLGTNIMHASMHTYICEDWIIRVNQKRKKSKTQSPDSEAEERHLQFGPRIRIDFQHTRPF